MPSKLRHFNLLLLGGVLFSLDRWLKWQTLYAWDSSSLIHKRFGWFPFHNPGIAFGLPVPGWLQILLTIPVLIVLIVLFVKNISSPESKLLKTLAFALIFAGALSNLVDRVLYNFTVDYLLIVKSVINLADVLVVVGFLIYFLQLRKGNEKSI
jgi:signal peptidase II